MLHLRAYVLSHLPFSLSTSPISPLQRFLSATAPALPSPSNQAFAVEDYLVDTCGLTRPQALKASTKLSHLRSPRQTRRRPCLPRRPRPLQRQRCRVIKDPLLLCAGVERTLTPVVVGLTGLDLSGPEISRLVPIAPERFRCRSIVSKLQYYLPLFGSLEKLQSMVERGPYLLSGTYLDKVVKPNVEFLRECRLGNCEIAKLCIPLPRLLSTKPERVRAMAACVEGIGVPRGSRMFRLALQAVAFLSEEKIAANVDYLKKTFRWSDADVRIAVSKSPIVLRRSKDMMRRMSKFLISEVGLEPVYIAHRPVMLSYSIEGRLRPRYYVFKFLKANGLLDQNRDYYSTVMLNEEIFRKKFICPHKEAAPHLGEDYAATCKGEVPTNFRFT